MDIKSLHNRLYEIGVNGEGNIIIEKPNYLRRTLYYNPITIENDPFVLENNNYEDYADEVLAKLRVEEGRY